MERWTLLYAQNERLTHGWYEAVICDNNTSLKRFNRQLQRIHSDFRWRVVRHRHKPMTFAQGLWTPEGVVEFMNNIRWDKGFYTIPTEKFRQDFSIPSHAWYANKIPAESVETMVKCGILKSTEPLFNNGLNYFISLGLIESVFSVLADEKHVFAGTFPTEDPSKVWFTLQINC